MPRLLCPWDLQARILEWIAIHASRGSSNLKIKPTSLMCPALAGRFLTAESPGKPYTTFLNNLFIPTVVFSFFCELPVSRPEAQAQAVSDSYT